MSKLITRSTRYGKKHETRQALKNTWHYQATMFNLNLKHLMLLLIPYFGRAKMIEPTKHRIEVLEKYPEKLFFDEETLERMGW